MGRTASIKTMQVAGEEEAGAKASGSQTLLRGLDVIDALIEGSLPLAELSEKLDLTRANARTHLSFGYGIHFCLGQQLAKMEFAIAMKELARRLPTLRLVPDQDFAFAHNTSFRIPTALHIEWDL